MLNRTFLEMSYCQQNFGKNKIEILPFFGVNWGLIPIFGPIGAKLEKSV